MNEKQESIFWGIVAGSAAVLAGISTRSALKTGWRKVKGSEPPDDPHHPEVSWGDALAWTALTGAVVGISRLVATRLAASGWKKLYHADPPEGG